MPATFPETDFRAFGLAASRFFPSVVSDEALFDPQKKRRQFDYSWQAVRYRYRSCAECQDEFKALLNNPSDLWRAGWPDEELTYKLERCIYVFFMSGLSVFDSFAFCLYFLGHAIQPAAFPDVTNPRKITRKLASKAFSATFPQTAITQLLAGLSDDTRIKKVESFRNLVGHRISGTRSVSVSSTMHPDGPHTDWREETWYLPGAEYTLEFDENMLQCLLDDINGLLTSLATAARVFAESHQPKP